MKVYIASLGCDCEGEEIVGVDTTFFHARELLKNKDSDFQYIREYELGTPDAINEWKNMSNGWGQPLGWYRKRMINPDGDYEWVPIAPNDPYA